MPYSLLNLCGSGLCASGNGCTPGVNDTLRDPIVGLSAGGYGSTPGVNETFRDPSVGLFSMAGRWFPPSAVLGLDAAASSS